MPPFLTGAAGWPGFGRLAPYLERPLAAFVDAEAVEGATDDVVTDTRQILHTAAADEDDGVLLKVVAFTADVGDDFEAVGEADLGDLTKRGVRLLGRAGHHLQADPTALRAIGQSAATWTFPSWDGVLW